MDSTESNCLSGPSLEAPEEEEAIFSILLCLKDSFQVLRAKGEIKEGKETPAECAESR